MKNSTKTIIFDFDHTLFNTKDYSEAMKKFFLKNGISEELYASVAKEQRGRRHNCVDFFEIVRDLKDQGYNISPASISNFINQDLAKYLKGPVHQVLDELKANNFSMALLSKGVNVFQMLKINKSGIEPFFGDKIFITEENKEDIVHTIPMEREVYFVNDHADEIETIKKIYPQMNFVYVKGPKTHHDRFLNHEHIKTIADISELPEILDIKK